VAWKDYSSSSTETESKDLVWDLRQIYANKIVGITLEQIKVARTDSNFQEWFRLLTRDLRVETNHKMTSKERIKVNEQIEKVKSVIQRYEQTYTGKDKNAVGYQKIDNELCILEMIFWDAMEQHNMLGKPEGDEGLF
jgi:hypothetical protein